MSLKYLKYCIISIFLYMSLFFFFIYIGFLTTTKLNVCSMDAQVINSGGHIFPKDYRVLQPWGKTP